MIKKVRLYLPKLKDTIKNLLNENIAEYRDEVKKIKEERG